ncbi:hypothetical protein BJ508DRAFT_357450 [Ascobolus immersus RN42]|uniref:Uncharacterized protein n=1 Tax=Ascobolus immersus RN42 TaxID=1160509 RepID=A0A3N4IZA1_ASCIM|nr:hypothetical protein BJ508DRAFT_357450 [Ascobolus immersus RN42]
MSKESPPPTPTNMEFRLDGPCKPIHFDLESRAPTFPLWGPDCTHISRTLQQAVKTYCSDFDTIYAGIPGYILRSSYLLNNGCSYFSDSYPVRLRAITDRYLLFVLTELLPFAILRFRALSEEQMAEMTSQMLFASLLNEAVDKVTNDELVGGMIRKRIAAGLFREGQGRLVELGLEVMMEGLRMVMRKEVEIGYVELFGKVVYLRDMVSFVGMTIRSERMESAILGYVGEEGVNLEVVRAVGRVSAEIGARVECQSVEDGFYEGWS